MKQIGKVIGLLLLVYLGYLGYRKYKQGQMPQSAILSVSEQIDSEYHNERALLDYYDLTFSLNAVSKKAWHEYLEDITSSTYVNPEFIDIQSLYQQKRIIRDRLEQKLIRSKVLKADKHYDNFDVIQSENRKDYYKPNTKSSRSYVIYERGDVNDGVRLVQNILSSLGYKLQLDGVFRQETEFVVKQYQKDKHLIESGYVDFNTYESLIKDTRPQHNE